MSILPISKAHCHLRCARDGSLCAMHQARQEGSEEEEKGCVKIRGPSLVRTLLALKAKTVDTSDSGKRLPFAQAS
jgi:hypothetical protein